MITTWKSALTLTIAAAMVATTAFAQSSGGGTTSPQMPGGAKQPEAGAPVTTPPTSGSTKPESTSPSASPATSADKPADSSTPSASPSTTDPAKSSDTMKSERTSRMRSAGGGNREQVKAAQQALKDKGHDPGTVDGVMGPKTRAALKDFQKKEGVKDTGRLDQETMSKLGVEAKTSTTGALPSTSSPSASPSTGGTGSPGASSTPEKK